MVSAMAEGRLDRAHAQLLDAADPLAAYRERFCWPDPALVYLNGNSLGAAAAGHPGADPERCSGEEWGAALARSWDHWIGPARPGR